MGNSRNPSDNYVYADCHERNMLSSKSSGATPCGNIVIEYIKSSLKTFYISVFLILY